MLISIKFYIFAPRRKILCFLGGGRGGGESLVMKELVKNYLVGTHLNVL